METIGRVADIARYPVKSMRGESLPTTAVRWQGLPGDRHYAFAGDANVRGFPWFTGRDLPALLTMQPRWIEEEGRRSLVVDLDDGTTEAIDSERLRALLETRSGKAVRLHSDHRGNHDVAYVSLITQSTVEALSNAGTVAADHRRFRMNFVLDIDQPAFGERAWVGRTMKVGDTRLVITEQDRRCIMITFDPFTGEPTPAVLKEAGGLNEACAGVYASVLQPGTVSVGDAVTFEDA